MQIKSFVRTVQHFICLGQYPYQNVSKENGVKAKKHVLAGRSYWTFLNEFGLIFIKEIKNFFFCTNLPIFW